MRFTTTTDNVPLAYAITGEGADCIFCWSPAKSHSHLAWTIPAIRKSLVRLSERQRMFWFDWRNTGLSGSTSEGFTIEAGMRDLEAIARVVSGPVSFICGHGVPMALIPFAAANPELMRRIVIYCAAASPPQGPQLTSDKLWRELARDEPQAAVRIGTRITLGWTDATEVEDDWVSYFLGCAPLEYMVRTQDLLDSLDVRKFAGRVSCPVLVVQARDLPYPTLEQSTELAAAFPDGRLLVIEGRSYVFDGNEDPVPAILDFLTEGGGAAPVSRNGHLSGAAGGLSDREQEVLALIAAGKTNPEIAEALTIAPATASRHVHNILEKLGMSRRSEAAAWWASNGHANE